MSTVKTQDEILIPGERPASAEWQLRAVLNEECISYIAWNELTREALIVDPKLEELEQFRSIIKKLQGYYWIAVIDTHIHADHVSCAATLATDVHAPLIMHEKSLTTKADLRVCHRTSLTTHAAPLDLIPTPGHTADGITAIWGPYVFTGDTVLFGDVGRDDLPTGSPEAHYESLVILKEILSPQVLMFPGHDHKGGRASSWDTQLKVNSSLTQAREDFIRESAAFQTPAPKDFKRSLVENFK